MFGVNQQQAYQMHGLFTITGKNLVLQNGYLKWKKSNFVPDVFFPQMECMKVLSIQRACFFNPFNEPVFKDISEWARFFKASNRPVFSRYVMSPFF